MQALAKQFISMVALVGAIFSGRVEAQPLPNLISTSPELPVAGSDMTVHYDRPTGVEGEIKLTVRFESDTPISLVIPAGENCATIEVPADATQALISDTSDHSADHATAIAPPDLDCPGRALDHEPYDYVRAERPPTRRRTAIERNS